MGKNIFFLFPRPRWERAGVRVTSALFLIAVVLCFGQGIEPAFDADISLLLSRSIYMKPMEQMNYPINKMAFNIAYHKPMLNAFTLIMQVEDETLQPKTSFWKQAGIYGLELIGSSIGTILPTCYGILIIATANNDNPQDKSAINVALGIYTIGNMVLGGSCTWATGQISNQQGSWWKSVLGAGAGSLLGCMFYHEPGCDDWRLMMAFSIAPPLGAVISYNIK